MYCSKCGFSLEQSANYCAKCGQEVFVLPQIDLECLEGLEVHDDLDRKSVASEKPINSGELKSKKQKKKLCPWLLMIVVLICIITPNRSLVGSWKETRFPDDKIEFSIFGKVRGDIFKNGTYRVSGSVATIKGRYGPDTYTFSVEGNMLRMFGREFKRTSFDLFSPMDYFIMLASVILLNIYNYYIVGNKQSVDEKESNTIQETVSGS